MANSIRDYQGVLYDLIEEIVIERSPVVRGSYDAALQDAKSLVDVVNAQAEAFDDSISANATIGRVDDSFCFVLVDGLLTHSSKEAS